MLLLTEWDLDTALEVRKEEGMEKSIEIGIERGMERAARAMKDKGMDVGTIAEVTGLSIDTILKL